MRKVVGICCIALGVICLLISLGFVVYNRNEANRGEKKSQAMLQDVQANMQMQQPESSSEETELSEPGPGQMQTVSVGQYESIGILSIPVLELELPVLTDWDYEKLKSAPCHYYGSCYESDFVIAAHNYPSHFGRLSQLQPGDLVFFTDVTGTVYRYEVVLLETLPATATKEMITSGFDLSLYTCTPGGSNRVTVRCRAVKA
ncbi:MAG: sortase [Oscillospiraceae bacterium]|nr:sortase [Oscillospiraceae bacterium]